MYAIGMIILQFWLGSVIRRLPSVWTVNLNPVHFFLWGREYGTRRMPYASESSHIINMFPNLEEANRNPEKSYISTVTTLSHSVSNIRLESPRPSHIISYSSYWSFDCNSDRSFTVFFHLPSNSTLTWKGSRTGSSESYGLLGCCSEGCLVKSGKNSAIINWRSARSLLLGSKQRWSGSPSATVAQRTTIVLLGAIWVSST
jgi:hypothetical protein